MKDWHLLLRNRITTLNCSRLYIPPERTCALNHLYIFRKDSYILMDFRLKMWTESFHINSRERCVFEHTVRIHFIFFLLCLFWVPDNACARCTEICTCSHSLLNNGGLYKHIYTHIHTIIHSFQACTYWAICTLKRKTQRNGCKRTQFSSNTITWAVSRLHSCSVSKCVSKL